MREALATRFSTMVPQSEKIQTALIVDIIERSVSDGTQFYTIVLRKLFDEAAELCLKKRYSNFFDLNTELIQ